MSDLQRELMRVLGMSGSTPDTSLLPGVATDAAGPDGEAGAQNLSGDAGATAGNLTAEAQPGGAWAGSGSSGDSALDENMARLTAGLEQLRLTALSQIDSVTQNTQAVSDNTVAQSTKSGSSTASTLGRIFSPILSMMGISPLVSGIAHLFGGGSSESQATLTPYVSPAPIQYQITAGAGAQPGPESAPGGSNAATTATASASTAGGAAVQINVQAMDSKSFMDHSDQIAAAVRDALLRAHPLADVVNEV